MCLAVPGKIESINGDETDLQGRINFDGVLRTVALTLVPEAKVGDYVLVHAGCAIGLLDETEAKDILDTFSEFEVHP
ncbi:MAG TPA: hydrogenase assembly protein HupF [Gammaproteobacteria bacterium]|nr:hydrogenase assembly protein HupF [Gammaproteobacteria bacterium]